MQEQVEKIQQAKKVVRKPGGENITLKPFYSCLSVLDKKEHILNVSSGSTLHLEEPLNFGSFKGRLTVRMGDYEGGGSVESGDFILPKSLGRIFCTSELNGLSNEILKKGLAEPWEMLNKERSIFIFQGNYQCNI